MAWGQSPVRSVVAAALAMVLAVACGGPGGRGSARRGRVRDAASVPAKRTVAGPSSTGTGAPKAPAGTTGTVAAHGAGSTYGPYGIGTVDVTWVDDLRSVPPRGGTPGGPRTLAVRLYLPLSPGTSPASGPFPLVVWAHGLDATPDDFAAVLRSWAARGYVVAAPTFPLTKRGAPGGPDWDDYVSQPADIRFVVSRAVGWYGPAGTERAGLVDPTAVAVAGHSLGAVSALAVVSDRCCIDDRVTAAVVVDGTRLPFPGGGTVRRNVPLLIVHGDGDRVFPIADAEALFSTATGPRYMLALAGAPHTPFANSRSRALTIAVVADFLDQHLKGRAGAAEALRADADAPGLATLTAEPGGAG